jgi:hypothetical protein
MAATGAVNYAHATIMATILELCKNACTEDNIIDQTNLSHEELRMITKQMIGRELIYLH